MPLFPCVAKNVPPEGAPPNESSHYWPQTIVFVAESRLRIAGIVASNGLTVLSSAINTFATDCGRDGEFARVVEQALIERDIFVRMPDVSQLDR